MTLIRRGRGLADVLKNARALTRTVVLVGVPAETSARSDGGFSNASIGYLNETGMPERNLPARRHLVPGVASARGDINERFKKAAQAALEGDRAGMEREQHAAGLIGQNAVRKTIQDRLSPPLSPVTLQRRRTRKKAPRSGDMPLIDKGEYLKSITYVIGHRGK